MLRTIFSETKFWRSMLTLAIPIAVQNLLTSSFALIDTLMVGQLGDISLAAVGMAGQWGWLLNMVTFGICSGAAVFFAQFYGEGNKRGFLHTYGLAMAIGLCFALLFMAVGLFAPGTVLRFFNRDPAVLASGSKYLKIAVFSYPAILINMLINMVLRSTKRVKLPMFVSLFTTGLNAVLDYGLIFGAFGLPRLGIEGAAIATVISAWSGPVIIFIITAILRDDIFFAPVKTLFGFDKTFAVTFIKRACPVILNETLWGLGTVVYNAIFSNLGYEYTAAVSIQRTFENISYAFFAGLINAASVIIGQDIGRGEMEKATRNANRFMVVVPLMGLVIGALLLLFRGSLISLFNMGGTISDKTISAARGIATVYAVELCVRNVPYVAIVGVFRAGGDTKKGMFYEMVSLWAVSVPVTFLAAFVFELPFVAVFACSYFCEDYLKAFLCVKYFLTRRWIKPVTKTGQAALEAFLNKKECRKENEGSLKRT
ncbi:MAG: MATE family efflux transporter [Ruminococcaceae bacterium]|nr:MATE family efflux transporter [Oscillospiraceae bacterium]